MNERIDALVKKATIRVNNPILNTDGEIVVDDWEEGISISKFAELIVRECIGIVEKNESDMHYDNGMYPVHPTVCEIKKHFGVEL